MFANFGSTPRGCLMPYGERKYLYPTRSMAVIPHTLCSSHGVRPAFIAFISVALIGP